MKNLYAFLFPGQGSQYVGMGKDLYNLFPEAKDIYDRAEAILGMDIKKLSFEGPEEKLRKTYITQPAILVNSLAVFEILKNKGITPAIAAGHSLGEFSALYAAEVLEDFESVLKLVKKRGELMYAEGLKNPGTMAAIIGLTEKAVISLCKKIQGIVVPANFNAPEQVVISGGVEAVKKAAEVAKGKGAKVIMLPVSGAFHSSLLTKSAQEFKKFLDTFTIKDPKIPIIPNALGERVSTALDIRKVLEKQLISPVLWTKTIQTAKNLGFTKFYEVGPGRVLCGLLKQIDPGLIGIAIGHKEEITHL